jgi:hypothetical protein
VDTSLVDAWETLVRGPDDAQAPGVEAVPFDLAGDPRLLAARVRAEMHGLVTALARGDYEGAARRVRQDPEAPWDAARFARELAPFLEQHGRIETGPAARETRHTLVKRRGSRSFDVFQVLADPTGENLHYLEGEVDLAHERDPEGPLVRLRRFGS